VRSLDRVTLNSTLSAASLSFEATAGKLLPSSFFLDA
jgi:hypothetical protein